MNSFYVTLPSDSSVNIFPDSTQCCYKVKLPHSISIDKQNWEVALVDMIIPSQVHNISDNTEETHITISTTSKHLFQFMKKGDKQSKLKTWTSSGFEPRYYLTFTFPSGVYTSATHLVETIDETIQELFAEAFKEQSCDLRISYSKSQQRVKLHFKGESRLGIYFNSNLHLKLGGSPSWIHKTIFASSKGVFEYGVDLNAGHNHLYVYSDIAEHTFIGNIKAPLLRVLPFMPRKSSSLHNYQEFRNLHYVPVSKSEFDTIHINIRGDTGDLIHFVGGKSVVKLHFRQTTY